jgi:hypothetical protein
MKDAILIASIVLLYIAPLAAQSQEKQAEAYDFKVDRLGMSIEQFTANHPGQGAWVYCQRCKDQKSWSSTLCQLNYGENKKGAIPVMAISGFVLCAYTTTIAEMPAHVDALFADGKLATISILFEPISIQVRALVLQGLTEKLGPATAEIKAEVSNSHGIVLFWENGISIAEFEDRWCGSAGGGVYVWNMDISETLEKRFCGPGDSVVAYNSRVLYVSKPLGNLLQTRIKEAAKKAEDKARSDF